VEALIAGWGLAEARKRAEAYHAAGADAILIHSSQSSPAEIFAFLAEWGERGPAVLVPTKYWRTPTEDFRARRVSVVICANHLLPSGSTAMQTTARRIREEASLLNVEPDVAPLHEVFPLQGDDELVAAERRYLPAARGPALSAIVLAAGASEGFAGLTAQVPKAMLKVQGRPILPRLLDDFAHVGCRTAVIVRGHRAEAIDVPGAHYVDNGDVVSPADSHGVWTGLLHLGEDGAAWLREAIAEARADRTLARARLCDLLARVVAQERSVRVVYSRGGWVNVNDLTDLLDASDL
jgi:phosphoenolpyruvate phosphomutase